MRLGIDEASASAGRETILPDTAATAAVADGTADLVVKARWFGRDSLLTNLDWIGGVVVVVVPVLVARAVSIGNADGTTTKAAPPGSTPPRRTVPMQAKNVRRPTVMVGWLVCRLTCQAKNSGRLIWILCLSAVAP